MLKEGFLFTFISAFMALFPVANPVGAGFLVNGLLSGLDDEDRKSIIRRIITDYLLVGLGSLAVGHFVLTLFGLSLPVIQLGGGLLICRTALQWLSDSDSSVGHAQGKDVNPLHKIAIVIKGTSTACVGELCNFMLGAVFSAVAGFIYKHRKSRKTAILGALAGAAAMAVFSVPSNYFITYPAYVEFYHMPLEAILGMYQAILPSANSLIKCLVIFNMPFTLVKGLLDAVLCMLIYKPLSPILHGRK